MKLLNTKALLVIATLLAAILGILLRQENQKQELAKRDQERWEYVKKHHQQVSPPQKMDEELKNRKPL